MTEQELDRPQVRAIIQQVSGEGVPQDVRVNVFPDARLLSQIVAHLPDAGQMQGLPWLLPRE